jgi:hypothetical protein
VSGIQLVIAVGTVMPSTPRLFHPTLAELFREVGVGSIFFQGLFRGIQKLR